MKRFVLYFFMAVFCATGALGADSVTSRKNTDRNEIGRAIDVFLNRSARRTNTAKQDGVNTENRSVVSRNVARAVAKASDASTQKTNVNVVSRNAQRNKTNRPTLESGVNTVGRNVRTDAASINSNPAVRRAGVTLRATTAEVGGRAKIAGTDIQTGSNIDEQVRGVHGRASISLGAKKQITPTAESIANAKDVLEKTADLNSTCQQQYNECMDQFCAIVDANQKRCSCSENLAKYAKVQKAVEDANAELNDVAQNIRYLGLSADEIRAIMNATEAELELSKAKDTTQTRSMLEDIADMIKDPTVKTTYSTNGDSLLDMDLDFSSDSSDMFSLDLFTSSNDISAKRGKDLYKEATKRCKTVLNQCKDAGATESQITGNYDLAISKDCAAYEQGLEKLNQTLVSNVRSANLMLQKGRLSVLQNKNLYDIRGCIGALETCMLDDMVCGENYVKCLDPTKVYIDENGNVVLGRNITAIVDIMTQYDNSRIGADFIQSSINDTTCGAKDGACVVNYLMSKIGTGQSVKDGGLCRAVLDKCQDFTYKTNGKTSTYNPYNDVVVNYIQRAMVNIKAAQTRIISDYASSCMADISDCYNQQLSQINTLSTTADVNSVYSIITGACYNVALTCGYAVFAYDSEVGNEMENIATSVNNNNTIPEANKAKVIDSRQKAYLIRVVSDLFYQSLLCPSNSTFDSSGQQTVSANRTVGGYVNTRCKCDDGYTVWGGACLATCSVDEYRNTLGTCTSCDSGTVTGGQVSNDHGVTVLKIEHNVCSGDTQ